MQCDSTRLRAALPVLLTYTAMLSGPAALSCGADSPVSAGTNLRLEGRVAFTEGPAWHSDGNVYFTDIANNRIVTLDQQGEIRDFRRPSGRANGLLFDRQGCLLACEGGGPDGNRRVTRTELDGSVTVLAEHYADKKFNSPNDLCIDSRGRVYFTDPRYGDKSDVEQFDENGKMIEGVYRIDSPGEVSRIIVHEVVRPNGILVSADDEFLFVADNVNDGPQAIGGNRKLWRFNLAPDGTVDPNTKKLLFDWGTDRGPDGMAQDLQGRLYVAAGFNFPNLPAETADKYKAGIYVIATDGELLQFIPVPADMVTNCAFGGEDIKTLYITAGHRLWSIGTTTPGHAYWPKVP